VFLKLILLPTAGAAQRRSGASTYGSGNKHRQFPGHIWTQAAGHSGAEQRNLRDIKRAGQAAPQHSHLHAGWTLKGDKGAAGHIDLPLSSGIPYLSLPELVKDARISATSALGLERILTDLPANPKAGILISTRLITRMCQKEPFIRKMGEGDDRADAFFNRLILFSLRGMFHNSGMAIWQDNSRMVGGPTDAFLQGIAANHFRDMPQDRRYRSEGWGQTTEQGITDSRLKHRPDENKNRRPSHAKADIQNLCACCSHHLPWPSPPAARSMPQERRRLAALEITAEPLADGVAVLFGAGQYRVFLLVGWHSC